jgi:hypothetical protein
MPRRFLGKSIPSVEQVVDSLENGTERKYVILLWVLMQYLINPRQKEILAPFLTASRMIPLRIDIWHNLERIFFAGVSGEEGEDEAERYLHILLSLMLLDNFL